MHTILILGTCERRQFKWRRLGQWLNTLCWSNKDICIVLNWRSLKGEETDPVGIWSIEAMAVYGLYLIVLHVTNRRMCTDTMDTWRQVSCFLQWHGHQIYLFVLCHGKVIPLRWHFILIFLYCYAISIAEDWEIFVIVIFKSLQSHNDMHHFLFPEFHYNISWSHWQLLSKYSKIIFL